MTRPGKVVFGDFQTPMELAQQVTALAVSTNSNFSAVVEPTCGRGVFLVAAMRSLGPTLDYYGFDINKEYVKECLTSTRDFGMAAHIECRDFYDLNWRTFFEELPGEVLVIGNPPWVTNSTLGSMGGGNLPTKTNFQGHNGFDAKTGKANFDISEWMLIRLLEGLQRKKATLAMLCKTATARKVLRHAWRSKLEFGPSSMHLIDAGRYFGASVDACLLLMYTGTSSGVDQVTIYDGLSYSSPIQTFGMVNGDLVSDIESYQELRDLDGIEYRKWRSGVKHDAAGIMEMAGFAEGYRNGLGETYSLEPDYLYPLLKSSDLANSRLSQERYVLLTQKKVSDDTAPIASAAPKTWRYLLQHALALDSRGSSIYARRARFAVFGIGPYTFAPWKVAISGLHKKLRFQVVGSVRDKPIVLDDTCYFLPCESQEEADFFAGMLNSDTAIRFLHSLVFFDSKRAVTIDVLRRIDLKKLAERLGLQEYATQYLINAPFEDGAQQLLVFEKPAMYRIDG